MLTTDIKIEGQKIDILLEWRSKVYRLMDRLERRHPQPILGARLEIVNTRHHRTGAYELRLTMKVGQEFVHVEKQGELIPALIKEVFDNADRLLEERIGRRRESARHPNPEHVFKGEIARYYAEERFGFIRLPDGQEVYFDANALKGGGTESQLVTGALVKFSMEEGDKGPQAAWMEFI